jgi:hypothetical protein
MQMFHFLKEERLIRFIWLHIPLLAGQIHVTVQTFPGPGTQFQLNSVVQEIPS